MDWLTFIAKIIEFGAWPFFAWLVFRTIKAPVAALIGRIRTAKYKDVELGFSDGVRELKETLPAPIAAEIDEGKHRVPAGEIGLEGHAPTAKSTPTEESRRERLLMLADLAPRAAVLEAWLEVEHAAQRLIRAHGVQNRPLRMVGPQVLSDYLAKLDEITPEQRVSFEKLRKLRNQVVHFAEVSLPLDSVIEYIDIALALAEQFNQAAGVPPLPPS
jgi:hypothetical protein